MLCKQRGLGVRPGSKRIKRHKSCLEKQQSRATSSRAPEKSSQGDGVSCSTPPTYEPPQVYEDQVNYTAMLMAIGRPAYLNGMNA